jgi:malate dehydrogenase (oxaloacetate-decarboxylating)(NADP+)
VARAVAAIEDFKPTAIIGVSGNAVPAGAGRLFSREVVEAMARLNTRPIIFALSNPNEHHECLPHEAYEWTEGKAIYAGGVQFPPVHLDGKAFRPSQANNLYVFPAVGMAIYATNAKRVTDEMFIESAHAVADQVTPEQLKLGMLFPPQSNILETEIKTAAGVVDPFGLWRREYRLGGHLDRFGLDRDVASFLRDFSASCSACAMVSCRRIPVRS